MTELLNLKAILIVALIFIPLERLLPLHAGQKVLRKHWINDVVYLLFNGIPIKLGLLVLIGSLMIGIRAVIPTEVEEYVQAQPIWLQAIEAILVADLGFYLAHRTFHAVPFLWKFHAIHHSIEEMDWLAAHRVHPVDQILTMTASLLPVLALGFAGPAVAIYAIVYQAQSLLIHSNTRIGFGPLKWLLASPQFHHWHHANERQAYDKNFAGQLPLWDALLGTLHMPERMPKAYGCDDPVPSLYHQQLAYPIRSPGRGGVSGPPQPSGDVRP
ncbi:sterol desaturase family protein [Pseudaminobacter sp. 19-2017]|uniref:Sterol desaturase family protein n=1 Tax=Pseudaminobacter soli (ex Zhang et al. 2022) TaxID=2831468 RepID=A0A942I231_9HYPH|nr:sterol desaturase family protein [Pseudaminobacter soli]MBS3648093.1 sterol desaturase family protein [Pseudaminobacter soli]